MFHAAIAGTGRAVPAKLLTNADLEKLVETSDEWITTRTGIRERHMAADGETLSDFCVAAGTQALESAGVAAKDLDAVLVATVTPDQPIPAVACLVQQKLGAKKAAAWDQNAGCSGLALRPPHRRRPRPGGEGEERPPRRRRVPDALHRLHRPGDLRPLRRRRRARRSSARRSPTGASSPRRSGATARGPASSRCRAGAPRTRRPARDARAAPPVHQDDGGRDVQDRRPVDGRRLQGRPQRERLRAGRGLVARPAPGERPDHPGRRRAARDPEGALRREHRALRQHELRLDPDRPRRGRAGRAGQAGGPDPLHRVRRGPHLGRRRW